MTKYPGAYRYAVYAKSPNMEPSETVYSTIYRVRGLSLPSALLTVPVNGYGEAFSWKKVSMDKTGKYIAAIAEDQNGFIWISDDYGVTWDGYGSKNNWADIVISGSANMFAAIAKSGFVFVSQDGKNWLLRTSLSSLGFSNWASICVSKDGTKFLAAANDTQNHFIYYSNSTFGQTWNPVNSGVLGSDGFIPGQHSWSSLAASADFGNAFALPVDGLNQPAIYFGTTNTWFNSGQSNNNWYRAVVSPDGTFIGAVTSANLLYVRSGGEFTSKSPFGGGTSGGFAVDETGNTVVAAKNGGKIYRSTDRANTFFEITSCPTRSWTDVASDYSGENVALAASGDHIWIGNFNGSVETFSNPSQRTWTGVACSSDGKFIAACDGGAGVHGGYIHTSADGGLSWTLHKNLGQKKWTHIKTSNDGKYIVATETSSYREAGNPGKEWGHIWFSEDHGLSWKRSSKWSNWTGIAIADTGKIFATENDDGTPGLGDIYYKSAGAQNFNSLYSLLGAKNWIGIDCDATGTVIAAVAGKMIYTSSNSGSSWTEHNLNYDFHGVIDLSSDGKTLSLSFTGTQSNPYRIVHLYNLQNNNLTLFASNSFGPNISIFGISLSGKGDYMSVATSKGIWSFVGRDLAIKNEMESGKSYNCIASTADGLTIFAGGTKQTGIMMLK
ncbi:MAG: hypothetical protein BWY67_01517 [Bacteroidetes bacterium ADurb.Bin397]|nr:MAG: hypothetical protein BWY67_01517 [Bacteroidetes bacterium ADurb.Bin397]